MASNKAGLARLDGKVALITGASSGIGAGTAIMFCELGAKVVISGRKAENLQKTAGACNVFGEGMAVCVVADVTKEEDVQRLMDETIKHFGKLDILVNSAGIVETGTIETTSLEQYDRMMNINVRSIFQLTMLAVPHLKKTQGRIVNVSSINGLRTFPNVLVYNMSKGAVNNFTKCCALDLAKYNIRVNSVNPGVIVTEIHKRGGMDEETYQKFLEHSKSCHALGRVGEVDEVASTIAFLASDHSSFITGVLIPIDGGRHAMCPR